VTTLNSDCGLQDNLLSQSIKKSGADHAPLFLTISQREQQSEIRQYLERNCNSKEIAHKMKLDITTVDKYLSTLRSST
jgi:DNA-binding NarL/FixJ family response regulator